MSRGGTSFDKIFNRAGEHDPKKEGTVLSVHELFSAAMRDELPLRSFAQALVEFHNIRLTQSAVRLLTSTDAASGRLSFSQFQKALQEEDGPTVGAGLPSAFTDQAAAIVFDNSGAPTPVPYPAQTGSTSKPSTDISADDFLKREAQVARQAKGAFRDNPVIATNSASAGNPLARAPQSQVDQDDPYGIRQMANSATRMYISGELRRREYEDFLQKFGVHVLAESELGRLIKTHEQTGAASFLQLSRALQREIAAVETATACGS